jgi:hypothetical protein
MKYNKKASRKMMKNRIMKDKYLLTFALAFVLLFTLTSVALARTAQDTPAKTLVETVRVETETFKDLEAATAAGYGLFHGCVSSPQGGSMGVHFAKGDLVGDGEVDAAQPEALLYEAKDGEMRLVGVEYLVFADDWHKNHEAPPVLNGQLFNYVGSPNRYGLPNFYELHVWAWQHNRTGMFADFNPQVSCEEYIADDSMPTGHH